MKRGVPSSPASICAIGVLLGAMCVPSWTGEPYLVKDFNPNGIGVPIGLTAINGWLFFNADDGVHGQLLWVSDGTSDGTRMVKEIVPGPGTEQPGSLTVGSSAKYTESATLIGERGLMVASTRGRNS